MVGPGVALGRAKTVTAPFLESLAVSKPADLGNDVWDRASFGGSDRSGGVGGGYVQDGLRR
jgi:hypothetical protein